MPVPPCVAPADDAALERIVTGLVDGARAGRTVGASAAVAAVERPGRAAVVRVAGLTALHGADGTPPAPGGPLGRTVTPRTVFDLASITKVATTLVAATLVRDGRLDLEAPVVEILGRDGAPDPRITARHLLTHTAGLPPVLGLWRIPGGRGPRLEAVRRARLSTRPGDAHAYSCIGFILLGLLLEEIGGADLPHLARERVLHPLGAVSAAWSPVEGPDIAATEVQSDPPRGLVRAEVHDETAWSLTGGGRGCGNAGLFGAVTDLLALGREIAGGTDLLRLPRTVRTAMVTDQLPSGPATGAPWRQGLGMRLGHSLPDGRVLEHLAGHPGFTGTSVLTDPRTGVVAVLLTNRVHPRRERFDVDPARRELARHAFDGESGAA